MENNVNEKNNKIRGSLIGGAIGDALGNQIEFKRNIKDKEVTEYQNNKGIISDDSLVPVSLRSFISFDEDGYAFANQALPIELENDYNNFINDYYESDNNKLVNNIVNKIKEIPYNSETTIAQLIDYKPEVAFVSPLTQGIVRNAALKKCETNGIKLEEIGDEFGGLAYFVKFKKIN